ncbi:MAG TPA: hypothetical protein VJK03_00460 [Candidatus Nanoarchaeia archaeon]|nr:hypothetical protein [Candidatus Nanoarchaeia archaeon]
MEILRDFNLEDENNRVDLVHFLFYFPRKKPGSNYRAEMGYEMDDMLDKITPSSRVSGMFKVCQLIDKEIRRREISVDEITAAFSMAHPEGWSENPRDFEALYDIIAPVYKALLDSSDLNDLEKRNLTQ